MPSTESIILRSVNGIDFHGFSIKYNETGDLYAHRFHYWIWIGFIYYISNNPIIFVSVNHFRRITGAIHQITILIEHLGCDINNNSHADSNG